MAHLQTDGAQVFSLWNNEGMASRPKRPRDPAQLAKLIVDIATGQVEDRDPTSACSRRSLSSRRGSSRRSSTGTAPADLTVTGLARTLPYSWTEQERLIGPSAREPRRHARRLI